MKVKDIIKKQTAIIAIAVALVAITAIGVSYSIFFDVKKNSENQVITAGTLKVTLSGISALNIAEPVDNATGLASTPVTYTVKNTDGSLPASYKIYIYADTDNAIDASNIKISTDGSTSKALSSVTPTFTEGGKTYYEIKSGTVDANASAPSQNLRVWIDEDNLSSEITAKKLNLSMYIVSEVQE